MSLAVVLSLSLSGCMALTPQIQPTDFAALEKVQDRAERERLFKENWVYRHEEPQGTRYTKGLHPMSTKRSWQSLDAVLRSDRNASEALPYKQLRRSRIFAALTAVSGLLFIAGGAATAREGFDFNKLNGGNAILLSGALMSVAFAIASGVYFRRAQQGYADAVSIYNDSLGLRLGLLTPGGDYIPPEGVAVDAEGFILTEDGKTRVEGPVPLPSVGAPPPEQAPPALAPPAGPTPSPTGPPAAAPQQPPGPATAVAPQTASAPSHAPDPPGALRVRGVPAPWPTLTLLPAR